MVLTRAGLQQVCWGVLAGAAGGEAEGVQEDLPSHAEHHQLVVQILLPTLSYLSRPGSAALVVGPGTPPHPYHLLVLRGLLLLLQGVHYEPPLQVGVPRSSGPHEGFLQVTGRV